MLRLIALLGVLVALALPAGALAQSNPFGPLPPAAPEPTPAPTIDPRIVDPNAGDVDRPTLFIIGGGLLVLFVAIGWVITRDARQALPDSQRNPERLRDEGPHRKAKEAKAKARAKARAQRAARKRNKRGR